MKELIDKIELNLKHENDTDMRSAPLVLHSEDSKVILSYFDDMLHLMCQVAIFAGRPTKDGAKHLRDAADILREKYYE